MLLNRDKTGKYVNRKNHNQNKEVEMVVAPPQLVPTLHFTQKNYISAIWRNFMTFINDENFVKYG